MSKDKLIGDELAYTIMGEVVEIFNKINDLYFEHEEQFYSFFRNQIYFLANKYDFIGKREHKCISISNINKYTMIDVLWRGELGANIAIFKLSNSLNRKPVTMLKETQAVHKFLIYYGTEDIPLVDKIINEYGIHVIKLNRIKQSIAEI